MSESRKEARRLREQSSNRRKTIFRKIDELQKCGAHVYLLVEMGNKRYVYNSESSGSWPPPHEKIVSKLPSTLFFPQALGQLTEGGCSSRKVTPYLSSTGQVVLLGIICNGR